MCWKKDRSYTTADYVSGGGDTSSLGSYEKLLPGDALVRNGHIVLFTGWADTAHNGICALEQASTASDMQFRVRSVSSLRGEGYKAIRSDDLPAATTAPAPTKPPVDDTPEAPPVDEPTDPPVDEPPVADPPAPQAPAPNTELPDGGVVVTGEPTTGTPTEQPIADSTESSSSGANAKKKPTGTTTSARSQFSCADANDSGGCSVGHRGHAGAASSPLALGLAAVAFAFARRRRR
jgi:MYXO-CTERM domain-containing protein